MMAQAMFGVEILSEDFRLLMEAWAMRHLGDRVVATGSITTHQATIGQCPARGALAGISGN
ncbi:hypothetical protein [Paraburkholderia bonniea]|uniref:hypothetical protein n=1 Tax=Paraburkholderia bonniea TaxID=2152891 RepID=UPI0012914A8E|nr:hypothetical protein [Paraburkholderia bonniea]